jgi:hypothetical protein
MRNLLVRVALALIGATVMLGTLSLTTVAAAHAQPREDSVSWNCARQGNRVCGPGHGPNTTAHNVYYGWGRLPYIRGAVTTWPNGRLADGTYVPSWTRNPAAAAARGGAGAPTLRVHLVRPGQQLSQVARLYGTTVAKIKRDNGFRDYPHALHPGDLVLIFG